MQPLLHNAAPHTLRQRQNVWVSIFSSARRDRISLHRLHSEPRIGTCMRAIPDGVIRDAVAVISVQQLMLEQLARFSAASKSIWVPMLACFCLGAYAFLLL